MTENVLNMSPKHIGFAQAREILRNTKDYELDAIDAAFEVLIYSDRPEDKLLCEEAVEYMWEVPKPSNKVILILAASVTVTVVSFSAILSELIK
jgi:hypothetical protein